MSKIHAENKQTAQGIVEFALVLPFLLLIILGIFAFGHYFYSYSTIVSASREAARWGAAVGGASGAGSTERFRDCGQIRAAAVRVGSVAGVAPASVDIQYDKGPGNTPYGDCSGTTGPDVDLGDRILVTITVPYKPIVPLINMPSFNIVATTNRTIIRNLPAGEVPTAVSLLPTVTLKITAVSPEPSYVSQEVTATVTASGSDITPTGSVTLTDDASHSYACTKTGTTSPVTTWACKFTYTATGSYVLTAHYPDDGHYQASDSPAFDPPHVVTLIPTTTTITSDDPDPNNLGMGINVTVHVAANFGTGIPTGKVSLNFGSITLPDATLNGSGNATFTFTPSGSGLQFMTATYQGSTTYDFSASSGTDTHTVTNPAAVDPTITVTPDLPSGTQTLPHQINFTVSVSGPSGTPTGTISLVDNAGHNNCTNQALSAGVFVCSINFTDTNIKSYALIASYSGDSRYNARTNPAFTYTFIGGNTGKETPKVTVTANPTTSRVGETVTFTITVTGTGITPTGTVTFNDGTYYCQPNPATLSNGTATCSIIFPSATTYSLKAYYTPDGSANYNSASSDVVSYNVTQLSWCPSYSDLDFTSDGTGLHYKVQNGATAVTLSSVRTSWPYGEVTANLMAIHFDADSKKYDNTCGTGGNESECVWYDTKANGGASRVDNGYRLIDSGNEYGATPGWTSTASYLNLGANSAKYSLIQFSRGLPIGPYIILMDFKKSNGDVCSVGVVTNKTN